MKHDPDVNNARLIYFVLIRESYLFDFALQTVSIQPTYKI